MPRHAAQPARGNADSAANGLSSTRRFAVTELPLTGSGKLPKFRLREQIDSAELKDLPTG